MKSDASIEELLERCLERLASGEVDLDACLAELPAAADELRPLLKAARIARAARPGLAPRDAFVRTSETRLLNLLEASRRSAARPAAPRRARQWGWVLRLAPALVAAVLIAAVGLGSIGVVSVSAASLPGDPLYAVKRGVEELELLFTLDAEAEARLLGSLADERLSEIESLSAQGRLDDLESALEGYTTAVGRLARASHQADVVVDKLTWHIEVLEGVQARVPAQAQAAIERVIERSIDTETEDLPVDTPTPDPACRPEDSCAPQTVEDHDLRLAEQIAKIYGVTTEQAMAVFEGQCARDWKCVRTLFRGPPPGRDNQNDHKKPHP
jgi:hypothetical protein